LFAGLLFLARQRRREYVSHTAAPVTMLLAVPVVVPLRLPALAVVAFLHPAALMAVIDDVREEQTEHMAPAWEQ